MITKVHVENFKSIERLTLDLGRINVFIGENGSGKSNILEAIALATAAAHDKLDNEFLASRGVRVTEPRFMRAAFEREQEGTIKVDLSDSSGGGYHCDLDADPAPGVSRWSNRNLSGLPAELMAELRRAVDGARAAGQLSDSAAGLLLHHARGRSAALAAAATVGEPKLSAKISAFLTRQPQSWWPDFLIYAPENSALRTFQAEGQILPLGIKGEGLFAHIKALSVQDAARIAEIAENLSLIDWFERFEVPSDLSAGERALRIRDRYLPEGALFDQRSANEGFLFLLFYFTLAVSPDTPKFFAIDNVDTSLNPKLCSALVAHFVELAEKHDKQAILTTHNPAVLDGLDLAQDDQRLFVTSRGPDGQTRVRRVGPPKQLEGARPVRLSEAFLRGYIGGLPKNF